MKPHTRAQSSKLVLTSLVFFLAIIDYLENYAIGETPHVSIRRAVDEAKKIVADLKRRNHRQADIAARYTQPWKNITISNLPDILSRLQAPHSSKRQSPSLE